MANASAFDWSPGGCCCGPKPGWFDQYYWPPGPVSGDFQRTAFGAAPVGIAPPPYGSKVNFPWSIQGVSANLGEFYGYTRDGSRVWSAETYTAGNNKSFYLSCYDADATLRRFSLPTNASIVNIPGGGGAIGAEEYAQLSFGLQTTAVKLINKDGVVTTWPSLPFIKMTRSPPNIGPLVVHEEVKSVAPLDWPKATMVRHSIVNNRQVVEFIFGDIDKTATELTVINRQVIKRVELLGPTTTLSLGGTNDRVVTAATLINFDHFNGHWAAVIYYEDNLPTVPVRNKHYEVIIDGQTALHYQCDVSIGPLIGGNLPGTVHVCYPHESLGAGYVAFNNLLTFTTPPTAGNPNGTGGLRSFKMIKDGNILWNRALIPRIIGSTDRWLYLQADSGFTVAEMTDGKFTRVGADWPVPGAQFVRYYIAKHDGSEVIPMGRMTNTYKQMATWTSNDLIQPLNFSQVRNSQAVPGCLPGSYEEMWEQRNG